MREILENVMQLQPSWSSKNTEEMKLRGLLIRDDGPRWITANLAAIQAVMPEAVDDLQAEGRDGTGLKTEVPWFRLFSKHRSDSATLGFYLVYLFDKPGERAYLSLNQGTTTWDGADFKPLPKELLASRVRWAHAALAARGVSLSELNQDMQLRADTRLAAGYERGNIASLEYAAGLCQRTSSSWPTS